MGLDAGTLSQAMGGSLSMGRYAALLPGFVGAMLAADVTTVNRAAMWCAQLGEESVGLRYMEEIASGQEYEGRRDLGNTQRGDGRRFKGRGPIQVTGRHNYTEVSRWAHDRGLVPTATFFVDNPAALADDRYGFLGPVWYWTVARPQLNRLCDAGDIVGATRAINGGTHGLADRTARWNRCRGIGARLLPGPGAAPGPGPIPTPPPARKVLDMPERSFGPGDSGHRIISPTGSASAVVSRAWLSASVDGEATVEVFAQRHKDDGAPDGAGNDAAAHRVWNLTPGDRPYFELPDGTEFVTAHVTGSTGPGSLLVEQTPH